MSPTNSSRAQAEVRWEEESSPVTIFRISMLRRSYQNSVRAAFLAVLLCVLAIPASAAGLRTDEENARYLLEKGEMSLLKGDATDALERFGKAAGKYKGTLSGAAAQIKIIEIQEGKHRWVAAFDACQDYFGSFPGSPRFLEVLETQIRIALRVQREKARQREIAARDKSKAQKASARLPDDDSVSKMFRLLLANGAHTELEPRIRYELAVSLEREERPKSARVAYAELIEFHRDHYLTDDAAFQMAYIDYKKVLKGDNSRLFAAQLGLGDFLERYEKSEKVAQAKYCLEELGKRELSLLRGRAEYYEKLGKIEAALIYYDKLFAEYFDAVSGDEALRAHVKELRAGLPEGDIKRAEIPDTGEDGIDWPALGSFGPLESDAEAEPVSGTTTSDEEP